MDALGFERSFAVAGHDRGARVSYRLALDHPGRGHGASPLSISSPPLHVERDEPARRIGSCTTGASSLSRAPLPETLINADPLFYLHNTLARWAAPGFVFAPEAMAEYERGFSQPRKPCGARARTTAPALPSTTPSTKPTTAYGRSSCPLLAPGVSGRRSCSRYYAIWREWADDVRGAPVRSGHFIAEEAPDETISALRGFFFALIAARATRAAEAGLGFAIPPDLCGPLSPAGVDEALGQLEPRRRSCSAAPRGPSSGSPSRPAPPIAPKALPSRPRPPPPRPTSLRSSPRPA